MARKILSGKLLHRALAAARRAHRAFDAHDAVARLLAPDIVKAASRERCLGLWRLQTDGASLWLGGAAPGARATMFNLKATVATTSTARNHPNETAIHSREYANPVHRRRRILSCRRSRDQVESKLSPTDSNTSAHGKEFCARGDWTQKSLP